MQSLKDYSDELCREYNLIIVDGAKGNHKNRGEFRSESKEQSCKYELYLAVKRCKWCSRSKDDFIKNMGKLGYKVDWTDERKYITFTTPNCKKCRNRKIYPPEIFTKEALLKAFELNEQNADKKQLQAQMELLLSALHALTKNENRQNRNYPLTALEGQAKKERAIEEAKGRWGRVGGIILD